MVAEKELYHCRVCGLKQSEKQWGDDGNTPSYNICSCCGVEFGNEDFYLDDLREYRDEWLNTKKGKWFKPKKIPENWSLEEQLRQIPEKYK